MTTELSTKIINKAIECFVSARQRISEGMGYLFQISEKNLWDNGEYSSFGEFCEQGCGISAATGSKLVKVYRHYVIEGGLSHAKLQRIDAEKLYLAVSLPGSHEKQLVKAETWTRQEIKDELASGEFGDCQHEKVIKICSRCHKRIE